MINTMLSFRDGWFAKKASDVPDTGQTITSPTAQVTLYDLTGVSLHTHAEQKSVTIRCAETDACSSEPELWVEGWNIHPMQVPKR